MGIAFRELQHCNKCNGESRKRKTQKKKIFSGEVFVNRNERFVPLQCQIEEADGRSLKVKFASIKSGNCAH